MVKLVKNFRSHKAILQFPNEKFYCGDLVPCSDPAIINRFLNSPYLPSKIFPVVFHAIYRKDNREASSRIEHGGDIGSWVGGLSFVVVVMQKNQVCNFHCAFQDFALIFNSLFH